MNARRATLRLATLAGAAACVMSTAVARNAPDPLLGAWRLAALEVTLPDGSVHKADCSGSLTFIAGGHMAVQVMYADATESNAYTHNGYEASYGRYEIDPRGGRFTYHVESALVRTLIGQVQPRRFAIHGDELVIGPVDPDEHWRVVWKRTDARR